jgi:hypothetical protein
VGDDDYDFGIAREERLGLGLHARGRANGAGGPIRGAGPV